MNEILFAVALVAGLANAVRAMLALWRDYKQTIRRVSNK